MKRIFVLILPFFFFNCATIKPPLPKIEYSGPALEWNSEYRITQLEVSTTMFLISSPEDDMILVNIYKADGTLFGTIYKGKGGMMVMSLAIILDNYDFNLLPGDYVIILFGERGKTLFKLKAV